MASSLPPLRLGGLATGIDTESLIQRILDVSRIPIQNIQDQKKILDVKSSAVTAIRDSLNTLLSKISTLKDPLFYDSKTASSSDATVATATATTSAIKGNYVLSVTSLASASILRSGTGTAGPAPLALATQKIAKLIDPTSTLNTDDSYGSSLTVGTFSVNGATVTIDATDTLNSTFTKIQTATAAIGKEVTGSYDATRDIITLTSTDPSAAIVLGSGSDTSNFLSRSRLYTNGETAPATITSLTSIGKIDATQVISSAASHIGNAATITSGTMKINGVSISVDATTDTLQNVLDRITASSAGVYASYDSIEDRVILTSKTTGSTSISVNDSTTDGALTSNFASKMKLTSTLSEAVAGNDTTFTINGGVTRKSFDTVLTEDETGIAGLTITALKAGTIADPEVTTIAVSTDTSKIQTAVSDFVTQYNSVQNIISSYTVIPDKNTKPTDPASILSGDSLVEGLPSIIRRLTTTAPGTGTIRMFEDMGVTSSASNNLLTISDSSKLATSITNNLTDVKSVLTSIMGNLNTNINAQVDTVTGTFKTRLDNLSAEGKRDDDSIQLLQTQISQQENQLVAAFSAMEQFQAQSTNILSFLQNKTQ